MKFDRWFWIGIIFILFMIFLGIQGIRNGVGGLDLK